MRALPFTLDVPYDDPIADSQGLMSRSWQNFFRLLRQILFPLGIERTFELTNNQAMAADVENLVFSCRSVSYAAVDYLIQRVTTGGGAVEQVEAGTFYAAYLPTSENWALSSIPSTAGVTLTVSADGQVQYTSTNVGGTEFISRIIWRARTLAAKHSSYSEVGR